MLINNFKMRKTISTFDHMIQYKSSSLKKERDEENNLKTFRRSLSTFNIKRNKKGPAIELKKNDKK